MRKSLNLLFLLLVSLAFVAQAQNNLNQPIPIDPNVKVGKLPNGLTYYIRRNTKPEKKVELRLVVNAGSILERDDQQGLAHFMEHMNFNGTKNFPKNELVAYLESIGVQFGADLNAYTGFDETVYILPVPTEKKELVDKGLLILSDWASNATLDQAEIDKERGVVLEELRLGQGAGQRLRDKYFPKLLQGSQYVNRLPIGKKEILQTFKRQSLVDFYETWYRPDLMAVVVVGDIDVNEIEAKIKAQFSPIKAKRKIVPRPDFPIPDTKGTAVAIETDKEATNANAQVLYKKPKETLNTLADLRSQTIQEIFDDMMGYRLDEIRQSPNPPFISAFAGFGSLFRNKGSYTLAAATSALSIKPTLSLLLLENKRVKEFGFTASEFEREKQRFLADLENYYKERDKLESGYLTSQYVDHFLNKSPITGVEFDFNFVKSILPSITLEEVNALAKSTISEDNRVVIITGQEKEGLIYPTESEVLALLKDSETAKVTPYTETVTSGELVNNLPANAKISEEKTDNKFGITYLTLSNGVRIALKSTDFQADEILMTGFSPGGLSLMGNEKVLSGSYFSQVVSESGVGKFSKVELGKMLAGKKANVSISVSDMFENVRGNSTLKDFETMLQLTYLKMTDVKFDQAVFDSIISKQKMFLPTLTANPQFYFSSEVNKFLSQNNPRYVNPFDTETLDKAKLQDIQAIYKDRFADGSGFTFIFVGNFDKEAIKPLIVKYLGNLPNLNRKENWKDVSINPPSGKVEKVINKGLDQKSVVQMYFTGETNYNRDESRDLQALGELLTIKLTDVLREEKSGAYTVGASGGMSKIPKARYTFTISFPCGPENVSSLTTAALNEVTKIQNGQIDEKDIEKVREARRVRFKESFKDNSFWLSTINAYLTQGTDILSLDETLARIDAITKENLQKAANKYVKIDERLQFVLMPEDKK